ncbi:hypothetical protein CERZMDRAFT_98658 [Cercospora zeae-maydis SCOH1-5]|uniref:Uncharacterized protein n=1 Tax=Cercospora zeae-maydis SCOH1-5 TaxID=717836 RepID=A0A6A6FDN7_9PEZI|nr:hypothetical protein CERZMDRAFT_98658 [Cercospora zeae-maydis SCOH1-5]
MVPNHVYEHYMTLIIHPAPLGDVGPSALNWVLMGDDGSIDDCNALLQKLHQGDISPGRSHWGLTVLQAIEEFDAGPVWAFEQFNIDIDQPGLTKSELYRDHITRSAITATLAAIRRIQDAAALSHVGEGLVTWNISPSLQASLEFGVLWIDFEVEEDLRKTAHVHFNFYNGRHVDNTVLPHLIEALDYILSQATAC